MAKLNPFLRFNDGKCREAMNFYKECLGGEITFMTLGESPMAKDSPAEKHSLIMHSELKNADMAFFGSDMMRDKAVIGDNAGMALDCKDEKELRTIFSALSKGGEVFMSPEEAYWGGLFGMLTDKYGIEWMFNYQAKPMKK